MIIIGVLAAIAIPVFLNQRKKANDTAGKADVSTLGKEIATYYVDATSALTAAGVTGPAAGASGRYTVNGTDAGKASNNISTPVFNPGPSAGFLTANPSATFSTAWCVQIAVSGGTQTAYKYSATNGLAQGTCTSGTDY